MWAPVRSEIPDLLKEVRIFPKVLIICTHEPRLGSFYLLFWVRLPILKIQKKIRGIFVVKSFLSFAASSKN